MFFIYIWSTYAKNVFLQHLLAPTRAIPSHYQHLKIASQTTPGKNWQNDSAYKIVNTSSTNASSAGWKHAAFSKLTYTSLIFVCGKLESSQMNVKWIWSRRPKWFQSVKPQSMWMCLCACVPVCVCAHPGSTHTCSLAWPSPITGLVTKSRHTQNPQNLLKTCCYTTFAFDCALICYSSYR